MAQRLRTDWTLFYTVTTMVFFGLVLVYSASWMKAEFANRQSWFFVGKQAAFATAGFVLLMLLKRMDYRKLRSPFWAFAPLGVVLGTLVLVYFLDRSAHRWLRLPAFQLQPSEFAKPALAIFLAWFVTRRLGDINGRHTIGPATLALGILGSVVLAGDLGTAVVLVATAAAVFFVAGIRWRYIVAASMAGVLAISIGIAMKPYRLSRVIDYLDKDHAILNRLDPNGTVLRYVSGSMSTRDPGYQSRQSLIAVGSGGVLGLGLMQGRQKMFYVPEAHTDYIYSVIGEELGLWGSTGVLAGFLIILWRGARLFFIAPDDFGRYLALGLTVGIVIQALMNISVVLNLGPTKGIPLPMISYGGSSLLSTLISVGLLLSISERSE